MNYVFEYCTGNVKIDQDDLQEKMEEIMDQEFDALCEDGSIPQICSNLVRYLQLCKEGKYAEIEAELSKLPQKQNWLMPNAKITYKSMNDDSSDDETSSDEMDVDMEAAGPSGNSRNKKEDDFVEPEEGWTTVRKKK